MRPPYRSARDVLADVDRALSRVPALGRRSPLDEVVGLLSNARRYQWIGIYLLLDDDSQRAAACAGAAPQSRMGAAADGVPRHVAPIRIAARVLGVIEAAGDFAADDRHLLKDVAGRLARFLTGKGKVLVRKAREQARASQPPPAATADEDHKRRAAAGGKKRG